MKKSRLHRHIGIVLLLLMLFTPILSLKDLETAKADNDVEITIHYQRPDGDYSDWNLWFWEEGGQGEQIDFTEEDDFGQIAKIRMSSSETKFGFLLRKGN
ncbi:MAG TPA: pullulanase-associated domain-containing protein, partial [Bacteroidales bacterium]|nr:pullulanase-associated domain-containing protein [Bacteroidales bacterium]